MNEFALIFQRLGIDTHDVLAAAGTKWNFLPFKPGLVGGHCIGVDPYYLIQKAQTAGYYPDILTASRRVNDAMGSRVASDVIRLMIQKGLTVNGSRILVLGLTFKENCPDLRNTRVVDVVRELESYGASVDVCDPWADAAEARHEYCLNVCSELPKGSEYDALILTVAHAEFVDVDVSELKRLCSPNAIVYDVKAALPREFVDARL